MEKRSVTMSNTAPNFEPFLMRRDIVEKKPDGKEKEAALTLIELSCDMAISCIQKKANGVENEELHRVLEDDETVEGKEDSGVSCANLCLFCFFSQQRVSMNGQRDLESHQ